MSLSTVTEALALAARALDTLPADLPGPYMTVIDYGHKVGVSAAWYAGDKSITDVDRARILAALPGQWERTRGGEYLESSVEGVRLTVAVTE